MDYFQLVGAVYFGGNYRVTDEYDYNQEIRFRRLSAFGIVGRQLPIWNVHHAKMTGWKLSINGGGRGGIIKCEKHLLDVCISVARDQKMKVT